MSKLEQRKIQLLEMLQKTDRLDFQTVAGALKISESTTRRFFTQLEKEGKVIRVHGGIKLNQQLVSNYSFSSSNLHRNKQKTYIGNEASEVIQNNDIIFLDSGTTVIKLAEALAEKFKNKQLDNIIVLTNSLIVIDVIGNYCKVIIIGGEVRIERKDVCGTISEKSLMQFRVNKAFLGADGIMLDSGFMATDERTSKMNEIILQKSDEKYVLADSEKFGRTSFLSYAHLSVVNKIFTDDELSVELSEEFTRQGANIQIVKII